MEWFIVVVAGLFEVAWAVGLKYTNGFTRFWPSAGTLVAMLASILLLASAMKTLPLGTAYAVWTGIGTIGAVLVGILLFGEGASLARLFSVGCIVVGIVGLKLITP